MNVNNAKERVDMLHISNQKKQEEGHNDRSSSTVPPPPTDRPAGLIFSRTRRSSPRARRRTKF
eukprot:scaffold5683_cov156-Amphora_coffeaeformis.AAC.14